MAAIDDRSTSFDQVFDFTDDDPEEIVVEAMNAPGERRLATGTIPRVELANGLEPPDSVQATTRMSVEEVLELRSISLEARKQRAQPLPLDPPIAPMPRDAVPYLLPVRPPARQRLRQAWQRLRVWSRHQATRHWRLAAVFVLGLLLGAMW